MNIEKMTADIKSRPIFTEYLEPAPRGGYKCINKDCTNGSGDDGTGADLFDDDTRLGCRVCGCSFTNIDVIAHHLGIAVTGGTITGEDFIRVLKFAHDNHGVPYYDDDDGGTARQKKSTTSAAKKKSARKTEEFTRLDEARAKLPLLVTAGQKFRGLTYETIKALQWGFLPDFHHPKKPKSTAHPALIIPNDSGGIFARSVEGDDKDNISPVAPTTIYLPDGTDFILAVAEGAINAASAFQAVKAVEGDDAPDLGFVATGSTSNNRQFIQWLKRRYPNPDSRPRVVVMYDNDLKKPDDNAGQKAAAKLIADLSKAGFAVANVIIDGGTGADLNDLLQGEGDAALAEMILEAVHGAQDALQAASAALNDKTTEGEDSAPSKRENARAKLCEETEYTTGKIFDDCPLDLHIPPPFTLDGTGLHFKSITVCSTPTIVTKNFKSDDGAERIEIAFRDRVTSLWRRHIVEKIIIADSRRILELAAHGITIISSTAKYLSEYLIRQLDYGDNVNRIPAQKLYGKPGWVDDDFNEFVYPNTAGVTVYNPSLDYSAAFAVKGDSTKWIEMYRRVMAASTAARLIFGVALIAPLVKIVGISNQWVHLAGDSGKGKTAANKFAASIYGNPTKFMLKFNSTGNALEGAALAFNDLPNFVEELQTASKKARENLDDAIYNYEAGTIRGRCAKTGSLRPIQTFSGTRISSGEQTLTREDSSGEGAFKRIVEFQCDDVFDNDFAVEVHHFTKEHYGLMGRKWVDVIKEKAAGIRAMFKNYANHYRTKYPDAFPNHVTCIAAIEVAGWYFDVFVLGDDRHDSIYGKTYREDAEIIFSNLPKKDSSTNAARAIHDVAEFIAAHQFNFRWLDKETNELIKPDKDEPRVSDIYGYRLSCRGEGYAVLPNILRNVILAKYPSPSAVIRGFAKAGYLYYGNNAKRPYQKCIRVEDKTPWVYLFKNEALYPDSGDEGDDDDNGDDVEEKKCIVRKSTNSTIEA